MKTILALAILALPSCGIAPKAFPANSPNPLYQPGHTEPTVEELHRENINAIIWSNRL